MQENDIIAREPRIHEGGECHGMREVHGSREFMKAENAKEGYTSTSPKIHEDGECKGMTEVDRSRECMKAENVTG